MTQAQFALAQNAANVAYDMTMEQTSDEAQASDDYKSVVSAYNAAHKHRPETGPLGKLEHAVLVALEAEKWSTDEQRAAWKSEGAAEVEELAAAQMVEFSDWQHGERGAGCAGNSAEEYSSSTEGMWK
jgi:hypothetical protein